MASRHLFLVGYDISENKRRSRALRDVQQHALAGQKSFYECWLSVAELQKLMAEMRSRIDSETDRVVFIRLDGRSQSVQMGIAEPVACDDFFYIE